MAGASDPIWDRAALGRRENHANTAVLGAIHIRRLYPAELSRPPPVEQCGPILQALQFRVSTNGAF